MMVQEQPKPSTNSLISKKDIPPRERLIFALDVPTSKEAEELINRFDDQIWFYKLGLQLFMADGYFNLIEKLKKKNKKVFVDLKFFDVPETVAAAVAQLKTRYVEFATVHAHEPMVAAAVREKNGTKILGVTVLTSLDQTDIDAMGFQCTIEDLVLDRARRALKAGCDGVISSGLEVPKIRNAFGDKIFVVSPGIRPVKNDLVQYVKGDDQKRTVELKAAFQNGADYIVIGRPIRLASDPVQEASKYQAEIANIFHPR
ncbi:orotidine-5'-phosphate decarboxylase [bacterium]|nr:orotidine-5'-phosphate decarboxylase [bacterium]